MIPEGMRDVLPPETGQLRAIEAALCRRFEAYGYGEVRTPWLEYAETLETVDDDTLEAGYRLRDQQGHELMARTDMTVPVARLAAARFRDRPLPLRFFYVAPSHPPLGAAAQPGRRVRAGRRRAPRRALGGGRRRVRDPALRLPRRPRAARVPGGAWNGGVLHGAGRLARPRRRPREVARGPGRPRLPAAREHRRQRRRGRGRAQGAVAHAGAQRHARRAQPGAQDGQQRRHGRRHPAPRRRCATSWPRPASRTRVTFDFGLYPGPHLLQRRHLRGLRPGCRLADRLRRALRRPPGALRVGHPRGGLRDRRGPAARRARGGRRRAVRRAGLHRVRRRVRGAGAGHGAAPRRLGGRGAARRRARAAAPAPAPQRRRVRPRARRRQRGRAAAGATILRALGIA